MKTRKKLREQLMDKTLIINGRWETYADHFFVYWSMIIFFTEKSETDYWTWNDKKNEALCFYLISIPPPQQRPRKKRTEKYEHLNLILTP
jgi:hypothetical protein